jgi:hypothetical protein
LKLFNTNALNKLALTGNVVIPAKAGIQYFKRFLDTRLRGYDSKCNIINFVCIRLTIITFFALFLFCTTVSADYKIILKNGRDFVVENYKEVDGKIKFYRANGEIEIDKESIAEIKEIKAVRRAEETTSTTTGTPSETSQKPSAEAEKGKDTEAQKLEAEKRLREIAKKKQEMKVEGEKLIEEKKKIEEDIKKEGNVLYIRKEREYKQKIQEIEDKIKKFNEEVGKIDEEQEKLMKVIQGS